MVRSISDSKTPDIQYSTRTRINTFQWTTLKNFAILWNTVIIACIQESIVFVLVESKLLGKRLLWRGFNAQGLKNPEYLANIQLGFEHMVPHGLEHKRILVPLRTKTYKVCTIPRAFVANNVKKLWQIRLGVNPLSHNLHGTESYTVLTL